MKMCKFLFLLNFSSWISLPCFSKNQNSRNLESHGPPIQSGDSCISYASPPGSNSPLAQFIILRNPHAIFNNYLTGEAGGVVRVLCCISESLIRALWIFISRVLWILVLRDTFHLRGRGTQFQHVIALTFIQAWHGEQNHLLWVSQTLTNRRKPQNQTQSEIIWDFREDVASRNSTSFNEIKTAQGEDHHFSCGLCLVHIVCSETCSCMDYSLLQSSSETSKIDENTEVGHFFWQMP